MTEQEWLTSIDPAAMLHYLTDGTDTAGKVWARHRPSNRKLRMFGAACCRRARGPNDQYSSQVDVYEERGHWPESGQTDLEWAMRWAGKSDPLGAAFLRDIVGNPFQPHPLSLPIGNFAENDKVNYKYRRVGERPNECVQLWPEWMTPTVIQVARSIYEARSFEDMPVLADALEDAGCVNEDILWHCRGEQLHRVHVCGCWVLDLILGKE